MQNLIYLIDYILCQILKIILNISKKKLREKTVINPSIRLYVNKIENRLHLKLKQYYFLTFNTTNNEITWKHKKKRNKYENGKTVSHLEITEIVLLYCNIVKNDHLYNF